MSDALVVRGQVYKHWQYKYPEEGNVADKLIIVLNKIHLPSQPIIVVPVSTTGVKASFLWDTNLPSKSISSLEIKTTSKTTQRYSSTFWVSALRFQKPNSNRVN